MTPREYAAALYAALRGQGKKDVEQGVERLVAALKTRGALRLLPQVLAELPKAIDDAEAGNRMTIETARELDDAAVARIAESAGATEQSEVRQRVRPELIGGARIKTAGTTIDASVRGRLMKIKAALAHRAS